MSKVSYEYLDVEVIEKFKQGDQDAFNEIYHKYYQNVYYLAFHYFYDEEKAKDIVQETFMIVCESIHKLAANEAFFVWLNRIAYNCCNNAYRKSRTDASHYKKEKEDGFIEESSTFSYTIDYGNEMEMSRAKKIIVSSLEKMSEELRIVGYLNFFEELSYQEIAEVTDIPMGTVKSRINRIKKRLKKDLERNNIRKESCFSLLLTPGIVDIYKQYVQAIPYETPKNAIDLNKVKIGRDIGNAVKHMTIPKLITILSMVALPVSGVIYEESINSSQGDFAKIDQIEYMDKLTNQSITIKTKTTNDKYDDIQLNGQRKLVVDENGLYTISLLINGKVIDSKEINITNIDKEAPITKEVIQKDYVELHFSDNNGIDYQNIEVIENGQSIKDYKINQDKDIIYFPKDIAKKTMILIPDLAGNIARVKLSFREVYT